MARIVVGYDGSRGSERALRWAADEAELRGAELELVSCWQFPLLPASFGTVPIAAQVTDELVTAIDRDAEQARNRLTKDHEDLDVHITVTEGHPATALLAAAEEADLLVVGSHGRGAFASLLLGSVSLHCVAHAPCPVVVVRPDLPS